MAGQSFFPVFGKPIEAGLLGGAGSNEQVALRALCGLP